MMNGDDNFTLDSTEDNEYNSIKDSVDDDDNDE